MSDARKKHKAYLDQHVKDVNGEYRYLGDWFQVRGGKKALLPYALAVALACAGVIGAGCVDFPGMRNTWYVILPYILEAALLFALIWQSARLFPGRVKAYALEAAQPRIIPLAAALALAEGLSAVCAGIFLLRHGAPGHTAACILYFALKALTACAALAARRAFQQQLWEKC